MTISIARPSEWRRAVLGVGLTLVVAACAATGASPTATPLSSVSGVTATPANSPSANVAPTATASPTDTALPTTTPKATPKLTPKPTPLPALAIGLCTGSQLKLTLDYWIGSSGNPSYAHVHLSNVSSATCNMRGTPRSQIVSGSGSVIVDSGSGSGEISTGDPVWTLIPNGVVYSIIEWDNWCKSAPKQKVTVAVYVPFGLGRLQAKAPGDAPIANCSSSGSKSKVAATQWNP
jgi:hypothetical protein